jgi:hypothetical protein
MEGRARARHRGAADAPFHESPKVPLRIGVSMNRYDSSVMRPRSGHHGDRRTARASAACRRCHASAGRSASGTGTSPYERVPIHSSTGMLRIREVNARSWVTAATIISVATAHRRKPPRNSHGLPPSGTDEPHEPDDRGEDREAGQRTRDRAARPSCAAVHASPPPAARSWRTPRRAADRWRG